ncbi:MAG: chromate transporter [Candidatus Krumholzibacteriia bacterium]
MLWKLFVAFLKVGVFGYGSGPAMLVLIQREMADLGLMDAAQFNDAVAVSTALPGPLATKMALYCGHAGAGVPGAAVALVAMLLPSTLGILIVARFLMQYKDQPKVAAALRALRPVVVAIFLFLAYNAGRQLRPQWDALALGLVALVLLVLRVEPAWVVLGAVIVGLIFY